ncbi:MAG: nucleoside triphosphate pyrophosphohydrolase family protein [Bacteroidetes bacterium]|nr:nucleoside triphosphate pyrophosphohydrolase family protein [Bacteroidota bacterium]MDA0828509.1 nucleoside triphosphate pyrophosphohydrolase family protein [Bacteroidota bacterium]MDA1198678.1 nucleoside triphosphate pyrophosphohydrolase family protein [Bacteroidota bacterium]
MQEQIAAVTKFHEVYRIPYAVQPTTDVDPQLIALRHRLMAEENEEYLEAALAGNLVEVADALGDMLYILCGTMITHGMQDKIEDVFREIQRSNLSKLGAHGQPIYREDGKVMKGPNYFKPDIAAILAGR